MLFEMVLEMAMACGAVVKGGQQSYDLGLDFEFDWSQFGADAFGAICAAVGFEPDEYDLYSVLENLACVEGVVYDNDEDDMDMQFCCRIDGQRYYIGYAGIM